MKKAQEKKLDVFGTARVGEVSKKVQESRLKLNGMGMYQLRREEEYVSKRVMVMEVAGKRRRRPKRRWLLNDLSERELSGEEAQASHKKHRPSHKSGKGCGRRSVRNEMH